MTNLVVIFETREIQYESNLYLYDHVYDENDEIKPEEYEVVTLEKAIEYRIGRSQYTDCTGETNEAYRIANAPKEYLNAKSEFTSHMTKNGWEVVHDQNLSIYFEKDSIRVRFSEHRLGTDSTGRQQTGGAQIDLVWSEDFTTDELIEDFNEQLEAYED